MSDTQDWAALEARIAALEQAITPPPYADLSTRIQSMIARVTATERAIEERRPPS